MKVLVVDDEKDTKVLFEQRFRKSIRSGELMFDFVFSGEDALMYLSEHHSETILILSDINMPGMSGLELLKSIKNKYTSPPRFVLMITAYNDIENYNEAMSLGADDFLTKPLNFNLLKDKLMS